MLFTFCTYVMVQIALNFALTQDERMMNVLTNVALFSLTE